MKREPITVEDIIVRAQQAEDRRRLWRGVAFYFVFLGALTAALWLVLR